MKKLVLTFMVVCLSGAVVLGAAAPEPGTLPENVLGMVEVPRMDNFQENLQAYSDAIEPDKDATGLPRVLIAGLTKSQTLDAFNWEQPFRILWVPADEGKIVTVISVSVTTTQDFFDSLLPTLRKGADRDGLHCYEETKTKFDAEAYKNATPEEQQNFQAFMKKIVAPFFIGEAGTTLCMGENEAGVRLALDLLKTEKLPQTAIVPGNDISALVDIQKLTAALTTEEGTPFQRMSATLQKQMEAAPATGLDRAGVSQILQMELDAFEKLAQQVVAVSAGVTLDANDLGIETRFEASENTPLAAYLASVPDGLPASLKYLPDDAILVMSSRMGDMKPLTDWMIDFQTKIAGSLTEQTPEQAAALAEYTKQLMSVYGDDFSIAWRGGEGLRLLYALTTKDPQTIMDLYAGHFPECLKTMMAGYEKMGLKISLEASEEPLEYAGHSIWSWRIPMEWVPPANEDPAMQRASEMMPKIFKILFQDSFKVDWSLLGNDWVLAAGPDSLDAMKTLLDKEQALLIDSPSFKKILADAPSEMEGIVLLHLTDLLEFQFAAARKAMAEDNPILAAGMTPVTFERGPGILATLQTAPTSATVALTVPAAEIKAVKGGFEGEDEDGMVGEAPEEDEDFEEPEEEME